ncbi:MAG: hypothetical protein ACI8TQ_003450 [Planctomycetota bacterium]
MFEQELTEWIEANSGRDRLSALQLEELSDHLLHKAELLVAQGCDHREAFSSAACDLGDISLLAKEFQKANPAMSPISKWIGTLITGVLLLYGTGFVVPLWIFVHVPSLAVVFGVVTGGLWASFGPRTVWRTIRFTLAGAGGLQAGERELFEAVLQRGYGLSWAAGVLGALVSLVSLLQNLYFEDMGAFGQAVAMCLLTLLYGAILAELGFRTLRQWLRASEVRSELA